MENRYLITVAVVTSRPLDKHDQVLLANHLKSETEGFRNDISVRSVDVEAK